MSVLANTEVRESARASESVPRFASVASILGQRIAYHDRALGADYWYRDVSGVPSEPTIQLVCRADGCALNVGLRRDSASWITFSVRIDRADCTLAEVERLWLERASLEVPRLCALVVDGMAAT